MTQRSPLIDCPDDVSSAPLDELFNRNGQTVNALEE
jgi:hypothetical protein